MRIRHFFKKKIITIYLHPGGEGGRGGRGAGLVLFTRDTVGEGVGGGGDLGGWEAEGVEGPHAPIPLSSFCFPPPQPVKILLKSPPQGLRLVRGGTGGVGWGLVYLCPLV